NHAKKVWLVNTFTTCSTIGSPHVVRSTVLLLMLLLDVARHLIQTALPLLPVEDGFEGVTPGAGGAPLPGDGGPLSLSAPPLFRVGSSVALADMS
ncbi:hypothetical protein KI387_044540, partial [Taxus chinensis]